MLRISRNPIAASGSSPVNRVFAEITGDICNDRNMKPLYMSKLRNVIIFILVIFILPAGASLIYWGLSDRPGNWRSADWSSSGLLPRADGDNEAALYVLAARTGGLKGALSLHSWVVVKEAGQPSYDRYDKVGWGNPIQRNRQPADGRWYSNAPFIVAERHGEAAERLVPKVQAAIGSYPYRLRGDYRLWPGPNSNSFIAHILHEVPELQTTLPSNAVGRDYRPGIINLDISPDWRDIHVTFGGLMGFAFGLRYGLEVQLLGLVAGFDFANPAIKVPGWGRFDLPIGV